MFNYIVVENSTWVNPEFNTASYPTVVEVKSLSGIINEANHYLVDEAEVGQLYIDGIIYNDLSEVPEESENSDFIWGMTDTLDSALLAREWRDVELKSTDWISQTPDHPQRAACLAYRTLLRNWPSTVNFPAIKPTLVN
jgi:hypothetical protein